MEALESPKESPRPPRDPTGAWPVHAARRFQSSWGPLGRLQKTCQAALGILARLNVPGNTV
eukprot:8520345-Pyramimonas_sp.AAC.1